MGVSRAAVAKHVSALRDGGYSISAEAGKGYRLEAVPDSLSPEEVSSRVCDAFWARFEGGGPTGSTNDDCKALARAGAVEGTVVLACEQLSGRGRLERVWHSPPGGVYMSVLLRPGTAVQEVLPLAPVSALALARVLRSAGVDALVKWPNDVLAGGGKLAGVLIEMAAEVDRVEWVVIGLGMNVLRPAVPQPGAAYLADLVPERPSLADVAALCLDELAACYRTLLESGFESFMLEYEAMSALAGRHVTLRDHSGRKLAEGEAAGVDESGRLLLRDGDEVAAFAMGEVTLS